jgi:hypothetical protein
MEVRMHDSVTSKVVGAAPGIHGGGYGWWIGGGLTVWAGAVGVASASGALAEIPIPMIAPLVGLGIALPTLVYAALPGMRRYIAEHIGLRWITALHVWRIAAAAMFFWYGSAGLLPERFVLHAGWGDLAAGLFAAAILMLPFGRPGYAAVHGFGFADFLLAVGTGLYFSVEGHPLMSGIATFPVALIPLFGVGVSGATHLIAFHLLLTGRGAEAGR